jgi:hypothetical protein
MGRWMIQASGHAFGPAVLLRMPGSDALDVDAEA